MLLYVIRHGETAWNAVRKIQGATDIPLNENGIRLAKITGEKLKDVPFDLAISSPLQRAFHTAVLVLRDRCVPIETDERIREISFGDLEGTQVLQVDPSHPFHNFFADAYHYVPARNGESIYDVCARTQEFYAELIRRPDLEDKTVLIATHGCTVRALLQNVYKDTSDFWQGGVCPNCGVNIIEVKGGKSTLLERDKIYY
ncbi:MAG: histidine phosphatase family protein [Lachnospiraceae bacterium]|jgi:Fructose-2,6-bisphosphatase|nr:histidine phosphatase family protein [Lachnospiraceae bacterium]MCI9469914.1 histidine phosphatase family protein [Lachnospiraceae bacterium]